MIGTGTIIGVVKAIAPLLMGRLTANESGGTSIGKGLLRSKTAGFANGKLVTAVVAVLLLPVPDQYRPWLIGAAVLDWVVNIWLRVKTDKPV